MWTFKPDNLDAEWFKCHPDRQTHIRMPFPQPVIDKQRAVRVMTECEEEFSTLGEHDKKRRRIILWKVPPGNRWAEAKNHHIVKIPFLAFAGETIVDDDSVLLPIVAEIMGNALQELGGVVEQDGI